MPLIGWTVCTSGSLVFIASTFVSPCLQVACAGTLYQGPCSCACIRSRDARRGVKWASTVERVAVHLYLKLPSPSVAPYKQDTSRTGRDGGVVSITTLTFSRTANVKMYSSCATPGVAASGVQIFDRSSRAGRGHVALRFLRYIKPWSWLYEATYHRGLNPWCQ